MLDGLRPLQENIVVHASLVELNRIEVYHHLVDPTVLPPNQLSLAVDIPQKNLIVDALDVQHPAENILNSRQQHVVEFAAERFKFVLRPHKQVLGSVDANMSYIGDVAHEDCSIEHILTEVAEHPFDHQQVQVVLVEIESPIEAVSCVRRVVGRIGTFHEPVPALSVFLDVTVRAEHPPSR